ncbi:MAG TPA: helix-turn-helix domain-containing protein [Micromonosporaceae bacterium]
MTKAQVDIGDGIRVPETVQGYVTYPDAGYEARVTALYDSGVGRYRVRTLTVEATGDRDVTGEMLRKVRVAEVLRDAVNREMTSQLWPLAGGPDAPSDADGQPTTETLTYVALVYRLALVTGDPPTQAVARALKVSRNTASRLVTRAWDRGLLTVQDPRGAKRA